MTRVTTTEQQKARRRKRKRRSELVELLFPWPATAALAFMGCLVCHTLTGGCPEVQVVCVILRRDVSFSFYGMREYFPFCPGSPM